MNSAGFRHQGDFSWGKIITEDPGGSDCVWDTIAVSTWLAINPRSEVTAWLTEKIIWMVEWPKV